MNPKVCPLGSQWNIVCSIGSLGMQAADALMLS